MFNEQAQKCATFDEQCPVVIGIDPGKSGAVVVLDLDRNVVKTWITKDAFTVAAGKTKRAYNEIAMRRAFEEFEGRIALVILEKQQAMPGQGVSSTFQTGLGFGLWRGVLAGIPTKIVHPRTWQKVVCRDLPGTTKARAILACGHQLPDLDLTPGRRRKPFDGLADAGAMALFALKEIGR
jgi:hypothetical protein